MALWTRASSGPPPWGPAAAGRHPGHARRAVIVSALTGAALAAAGLGLALGLGFALGLFRPHPAGAPPDTRSGSPRHPERHHAGR